MTVLVAVPYRDGGCDYRRRAWPRVEAHLREALPGARVVVVDDGGDPFSRGASLNLAFTESDAEIVVACDADLLVGVDQLREAVHLAKTPGMVLPFSTLVYCYENESTAIINGEVDYRDADGRRWDASPTIPCLGGCNVLSRQTWQQAGGWLPVFRGWGCEDLSWSAQCGTLVGPNRRLQGDAVHLYHPKTGVYVDEDGINANGELMRRVLACEGDPDAMRTVVEELSAS